MKTRVEADIDGHHCIRAAADLAAAEVIFDMEGVVTNRPDRHSVQVGPGLHLHTDGPAMEASGRCRYPWMYTNHSCAPNARVMDRKVVALRGIRAGEEITFDYDTNEYDMASPFECHCEDVSCRGLIRGYKHLSSQQRDRLDGKVNPYLVALAEGEVARAGSAD